jgi:hypothetical protein
MHLQARSLALASVERYQGEDASNKVDRRGNDAANAYLQCQADIMCRRRGNDDDHQGFCADLVVASTGWMRKKALAG